MVFEKHTIGYSLGTEVSVWCCLFNLMSVEIAAYFGTFAMSKRKISRNILRYFVLI